MRIEKIVFITILLSACFIIFSFLACNGDDDDDDEKMGGDTENPFWEAEERVGEWVWIPVKDTICRTGESTGIGARLQQNSDNLVIFIQGGGNCHSEGSCSADSDHGTSADFDLWTKGDHSSIDGGGELGIFNVNHEDNPVREWNFVLIPYCTGDYHSGSAQNVTVEGVDGDQQFMGYQNMKLFVDVIAPYFKGKVDKILLAGDSAGGFGTLFSYALFAPKFDPTPITLLDDSGPLFEDQFLTPCYQVFMRDLWGMDDVFPEDCVNCILNDGGGMVNLMSYLPTAFPNGRFAIFSDDGDVVGRKTMAEGQNDCTGTGEYPHEDYRAALISLRDNVLSPTDKWATFIRPGIMHTSLLTNDTFFDFEADDVKLTQWVENLIEGELQDVGGQD